MTRRLARASRVLVVASRDNELFRAAELSGTASPVEKLANAGRIRQARETRELSEAKKAAGSLIAIPEGRGNG